MKVMMVIAITALSYPSESTTSTRVTTQEECNAYKQSAMHNTAVADTPDGFVPIRTNIYCIPLRQREKPKP